MRLIKPARVVIVPSPVSAIIAVGAALLAVAIGLAWIAFGVFGHRTEKPVDVGFVSPACQRALLAHDREAARKACR